jgi:hypothetical protein
MRKRYALLEPHLGDLAPTPDPAKPAALGVLVVRGTSYGEGH